MPLFTFKPKEQIATPLQFEGDNFRAALSFAASSNLDEAEISADHVPVCTIRRAAAEGDFWILQPKLMPSALEHACWK